MQTSLSKLQTVHLLEGIVKQVNDVGSPGVYSDILDCHHPNPTIFVENLKRKFSSIAFPNVREVFKTPRTKEIHSTTAGERIYTIYEQSLLKNQRTVGNRPEVFRANRNPPVVVGKYGFMTFFSTSRYIDSPCIIVRFLYEDNKKLESEIPEWLSSLVTPALKFPFTEHTRFPIGITVFLQDRNPLHTDVEIHSENTALQFMKKLHKEEVVYVDSFGFGFLMQKTLNLDTYTQIASVENIPGKFPVAKLILWNDSKETKLVPYSYEAVTGKMQRDSTNNINIEEKFKQLTNQDGFRLLSKTNTHFVDWKTYHHSDYTYVTGAIASEQYPLFLARFSDKKKAMQFLAKRYNELTENKKNDFMDSVDEDMLLIIQNNALTEHSIHERQHVIDFLTQPSSASIIYADKFSMGQYITFLEKRENLIIYEKTVVDNEGITHGQYYELESDIWNWNYDSSIGFSWDVLTPKTVNFDRTSEPKIFTPIITDQEKTLIYNTIRAHQGEIIFHKGPLINNEQLLAAGSVASIAALLIILFCIIKCFKSTNKKSIENTHTSPPPLLPPEATEHSTTTTTIIFSAAPSSSTSSSEEPVVRKIITDTDTDTPTSKVIEKPEKSEKKEIDEGQYLHPIWVMTDKMYIDLIDALKKVPDKYELQVHETMLLRVVKTVRDEIEKMVMNLIEFHDNDWLPDNDTVKRNVLTRMMLCGIVPFFVKESSLKYFGIYNDCFAEELNTNDSDSFLKAINCFRIMLCLTIPFPKHLVMPTLLYETEKPNKETINHKLRGASMQDLVSGTKDFLNSDTLNNWFTWTSKTTAYSLCYEKVYFFIPEGDSIEQKTLEKINRRVHVTMTLRDGNDEYKFKFAAIKAKRESTTDDPLINKLIKSKLNFLSIQGKESYKKDTKIVRHSRYDGVSPSEVKHIGYAKIYYGYIDNSDSYPKFNLGEVPHEYYVVFQSSKSKTKIGLERKIFRLYIN